MQSLLNSWGNPSKREIAGHVASMVGVVAIGCILLIGGYAFEGEHKVTCKVVECE